MVGLAFLLMLPLVTGAVWSANRTRLERQADVRDEAASVATTAAAYLDEYLKGLDALASALVRHPTIAALDDRAADRLFVELLREQPLLTNVVLVAPDGTIRGSAVPRITSRTTLPWVDQVVQTGQPQVSDISVGPATGKPFVALAYPIRRQDGGVAGVLALGINLTQLQAVFSGIPLPEGSVITVLDRANRVLARSREAEKFVGTTSDAEAWTDGPRSTMRTGLDGIERFYGDAPLKRAPWVLTVGIPRTVVSGRLLPLWRRNLLIALVTAGASLLFSLWLAQLMSRQLHRLRTVVQRIADGDLSPPVKVSMPNLELSELQDAFATMAANLREAHDALDRQVEQERRMNERLQSLQRQVVRQERLAAVGLLVSGVAHELNNPLQAILGTAELLERQPNLGPAALEEVSFLKRQSGRAREIIRNLSRFSHQQSGPPAIVDLGGVIAEVVQLRQSDLDGAGVTLVVRVTSSRKVYANFTELEQVTLNFVINAQQALEGIPAGKGRIEIRLFDAGKRVRLEVCDNGPGVEADDESKLFQPFFTTKPVGKGTGLGLSVSYGLIDSYGGTIGYLANEWGGATFFFELPAVDAPGDKLHDGSAVLQRPA